MVNFLDRITGRRGGDGATDQLGELIRLNELAAQLTRRTNAHAQPNGLATAIALRDVANLRSNSKLLAAYLAQQAYAPQVPPDLAEPPRIGTKGRVCRQKDFSSPWFLYWANRLKFA